MSASLPSLFGERLLNLHALVILCVACLSSVVSADEVRPFIIGGLATGGDVLHNDTVSDLKAGDFYYFGGGVLYEPENSDYMYQASLGYKVAGPNFIVIDIDTSGKGRTRRLSVFPMDVVAFYKMKKLRLGLGLSYFVNPEYERCSNKSGCSTLNFDNAVGVLAELMYQTEGRLFMGMRYTWVEYEASSRAVKANNVRVQLGFSF